MPSSESEESVDTETARVRSVVQKPKGSPSNYRTQRHHSRSRSRSPLRKYKREDERKRRDEHDWKHGDYDRKQRRDEKDNVMSERSDPSSEHRERRREHRYRANQDTSDGNDNRWRGYSKTMDGREGQQTQRNENNHKDERSHASRYRGDKQRRKNSESSDENQPEKRSEREEREAENRSENNNSDTRKYDNSQNKDKKDENQEEQKKKNVTNPLLTRTGGAYIPPAKLRMMQESITDKSSEAYQRLSWEALKKSINGLINKVNTSNIGHIVRELFQENIVRGRGVLAQSIVRAQAASPTFSHVYAALVAIINTKFPKNGELILRRLVLQFRRAYRRNDKAVCLTTTRFIAHLVNQQVAHEILALETLTLLVHKPTDDSVEVAIGFLKECGMKLTDVSPRGVHAVFERFRGILHSGEIERRVEYMIEVMFAVRKDGFKEHVTIPEGLDLVEEEDQITHLLRLEDAGNAEDILNIFKFDENFLENQEKYKEIKQDILGESDSEDSSDDDDDDEDDGDNDEEEDGEGNEEGSGINIIDQTETNLVALRRTIYLTIQSSLDYEECAHKLLKMQFKPEQLPEFCIMIIDCCSQQRSYEKFFGLLAQRFCNLRKEYIDEYVRLFQEQYGVIHRLETNKLRNVAKFFAHLLFTDAIPWTVLECIKLNEDDTTSSSRVFIKILFQELAEYMGMPKLNQKLKDPFLAIYFEGLFPRDNPRNTRFSINFFTSIGLGGVTDELREHLKNAPKMIMAQKRIESSDSSESSSESGDSSSEDESSSESSEDSEEERRKRKKQKSRRQQHKTPPRKDKRRR